MKIQKQSINKLLEEDLYIRKSLSLKRLLEANASRNMIMRIYRKQKDDFYKKASISKDNSNKKNNRYNNNSFNYFIKPIIYKIKLKKISNKKKKQMTFFLKD